MQCTTEQIYFTFKQSSGCLDLDVISSAFGSFIGYSVAWLFAIIVTFWLVQGVCRVLYFHFFEEKVSSS